MKLLTRREMARIVKSISGGFHRETAANDNSFERYAPTVGYPPEFPESFLLRIIGLAPAEYGCYYYGIAV
jgi:hypothetical protein